MTIFFSAFTGGFFDDSVHGPADIPVDAVEITPEEYQALMQGQVLGQRIVADESGFPVLADVELPPLGMLIDRAQAAIDAHFEQLYRQSVPNNAIAAEYDAAYMTAKRWLEDMGKPVPERVKALAESYGVSHLQAAQVVVDKWLEANASAFDLRGAARLRAKAAIRAAASREAVAEALEAGKAAMEAVTFGI